MAERDMIIQNSEDSIRPGTSLHNRRQRDSSQTRGSKERSPNRGVIQDQQQQQFYMKTQNSNNKFQGTSPSEDNNFSMNNSGFRPISMQGNQQRQKEMGFLPNTAQHRSRQNFMGQTAQSFQNIRVVKYDSYRKIPKNIMYDQESLYHENINLKTLINQLQTENQQLKARSLGLEEHLQKGGTKHNTFMDNSGLYSTKGQRGLAYVKNMGGHYVNKNQVDPDSGFIFNLKKKVKALEEQVEKKDKDFQALKKSAKVTRIQEAEIQMQMYMSECQRLKTMIHQLLYINQQYPPQTEMDDLAHRCEIQGRHITMLKEDNIQLSANLKFLEEKLYQHQIEIKGKDMQLQKDKENLKISKRYMQEREKELSKYKSNDPFLGGSKKNANNTPNEVQQKAEIEKLKNDIKDRDSKIHNYQRKLQEHDRKMKSTESELNEKLISEQNKASSLQNKINELEIKSKKILEDYQRCITQEQLLQIINGELSVQFIENNGKRPENQGYQKQNIHSNNPNEGIMQKRRMAKVRKDDVHSLGEGLKYKLMDKKIKLNDIDQYLFKLNSTQTTIREMKENILQQSPFSIEDEEGTLLLARFLIEDNKEDYVQFDPNLSEDNNVIRSRFKQLVQNYNVLEEQQESDALDKLAPIITQNWKSSILDFLQRMKQNKGGKGGEKLQVDYCSKDEFDEALNAIDTSSINNNDRLYLYLQLYKSSFNMEELNLIKFFDHFTNHYQSTQTQPQPVEEQEHNHHEHSQEQKDTNVE